MTKKMTNDTLTQIALLFCFVLSALRSHIKTMLKRKTGPKEAIATVILLQEDGQEETQAPTPTLHHCLCYL